MLFVLIYGIIEFGILFYDKGLLTNASREGARAGIKYDADHNTSGDIQTRAIAAVNQYLRKDNNTGWRLIDLGATAPAPNTPLPTIITVTDPTLGNNRLRVEVQWTYNFLVLPNFKGLGWVDLNPAITLNAVTEMMLEENQS
jgi:Flp pilus assembly protein TadG